MVKFVLDNFSFFNNFTPLKSNRLFFLIKAIYFKHVYFCMYKPLSSEINSTVCMFALNLRCSNHSVQVISYSLRKRTSARVVVFNCHYFVLIPWNLYKVCLHRFCFRNYKTWNSKKKNYNSTVWTNWKERLMVRNMDRFLYSIWYHLRRKNRK